MHGTEDRKYTSDSRSVDTYVSDNGDLVPLFSVGDQGANGDVAPPSTAKNVISVGASDPVTQSVANFSSYGYTKMGEQTGFSLPRLEFAQEGLRKLTTSMGNHGDGAHRGNDLYMSLSGSSQATQLQEAQLLLYVSISERKLVYHLHLHLLSRLGD